MNEKAVAKPLTNLNSLARTADAEPTREETMRALSRQTLALVFHYQKRFPEIVDGKRWFGRMRLDKRVAFALDLSKLMVPDEQLCSYMTSWYDSAWPVSDDERKILRHKKINDIVSYCLKKTGSIDGALLELRNVVGRLTYKYGSSGNILLKEDILRLAKLQRLSEKETLNFYNQLTHAVASQLGLFSVILIAVIDKLEELKDIPKTGKKAAKTELLRQEDLTKAERMIYSGGESWYYQHTNDNEYFESTKRYMKTELGISDLSLIEQVYLKRIVKECARDIIILAADYLVGGGEKFDKSFGEQSFAIEAEATERWLKALYDIPIENPFRRYDPTEEYMEYVRRIRARAHMP